MVSITLYHCGLLVFQNNLKSSNRPDTKFKVEPIPLSTVRPLIFKTIQMGDLRRVNFKEKNTKKLAQQIDTELRYEVEEMIRYFGELQEAYLWGGGFDQVPLFVRSQMRWRRWSGTFVSSKKLVHVQQIDTELRYEVEEMIRNICELQAASLWGGGDDQVHLWAPRSLCNRLIQSFAMRWRRWSGTFAVCV